MTDLPDADAAPGRALDSFEFADLGGHTIDELSDYLDAGRVPVDPSIESSPGCQLALEAMQRLRLLSKSLLETDARAEPLRDENWVTSILNRIALEARPGRDIPLSPPAPRARLSVSEGSVRALIRRVGDEVSGVLVGQCRLVGDVTQPGEPITVLVDVSVFWGESLQAAAARIRDAVWAELARHTELNVVSIDVTIHDVYVPEWGASDE